MTRMQWSFWSLLAGALFVGHAPAQMVNQPMVVQPTAFQYVGDGELADPAPIEPMMKDDAGDKYADAKADPKDGKGGKGCNDGCQKSCGDGCQKGGKGCTQKSCGMGLGCSGLPSLACMCAGDPLTLFPNDECQMFHVGGWVQIGYFTEGANGNGTGLFNNYPGVVQLQEAWLWVEKAAEADESTWDWGFRFDYVYGTDGQDTQAFGGRPNDWDNDWDAGNFYGHAIPQLYVDLAYDTWNVRVGHFYTIIGYEVVTAPDNFFYSHAFTMVLAEPFTHTGVLVEKGIGDHITAYGGYTFGWDTGFTRNNGDVFLGGLSVQLTESLSVTYTTTMGNFGGGPGGSDDDGYSHSFVADWQVTDNLNYVIQSDYVDNQLFVGAGNGKIWGVNQYLLYSINDCLAAGLRYEYFDSDALGNGGNVNSITCGVNVRPHANVVIRPEVRLDDYDPSTGIQDTTVFGVDMIMTW